MSLDIFNSVAAADTGSKLHLKHPITKAPVFADGDQKKKPITITLMGSDSKVRTNNAEKELNKMRKEIAAKRANGDTSEDYSNFDDEIKKAAELFAEMTIAWQNIEHDGKSLDCTKSNAIMVYTLYKEVRVQVAAFIEDKANFIKG